MRFHSFSDIAALIVNYAAAAIPVVFMLCFVAFFWNAGKFILTGSDSKNAAERKNWLIYGLFGIFAAACLGGLVYMLRDFIFLSGSSNINSLPNNEIYNPAIPPSSLPPASNA